MRGGLLVLAVSLAAPLSTLADTPAPTPPAAAQAPVPSEPPPSTTPSLAAPAVSEEPRIGFDDADLQRSSAAEGVAGAWAVMIKGVAALGAVLLLVYLTLGKGLQRFSQKQGAAKRIVVVDRVGLDGKRSLYLVEVDGIRTLVGAGEGGMTVAVLPDAPRPAFKDAIKPPAAVLTSDAHDPPDPDDTALSLTTPSKTQGDA